MFDFSKWIGQLSEGKRNSLFDKKLILKSLQGVKARKFLDTGCGEGEFTQKVAELIRAEEIFGVEIDAIKCGEAEQKGIKIVNQDLKDALPFANNYFDVVLSRQCIEHLCFPDRYLEEVRRVLAPNGLFVLTTTNLAALHYRLMLLFGIQPVCLHPSMYKVFPLKGENPVYGHKSVFTYIALKEVLERHHFKLLESRTHSLYFLPRWLSEIICRCFKNIGIYTFFVLKNEDITR